MGQEILYCYWCSSRILGADIDKGAAVLIGNHACCPECLPKVLASMPANQRGTLQAMLDKAPESSPRPARNTPRAPLPAVPAPKPRVPPPMIAIGGGVLLLGALALAFLSGGDSKPEPVVNLPPPPPTNPKPAVPEREKAAREAILKAHDAARAGIDIDLQVRLWDEAVALSERTPALEEASQRRSAILVRQKEVYAQELARLMDGVDALLRGDEQKKALDALASARKRHDSPTWGAPIDQKAEEIKKMEGPYRPTEELVCIEAERFHGKADQGEQAWTRVTEPKGFQGAAAMAASPNSGKNFVAKFAASSPRLDYRVHFPKSGTWYVWVRGWASDGTDDSVHLGLDGAEVKSTTAFVITIKKWAWSKRSVGSPSASMEVSAGAHVLNLWVREDGALVDRILLTTDSKYVPKDGGPPETSR